PAPSRWVATWTASTFAFPTPRTPGFPDIVPTLFDHTLRLIVRTSIGGDSVRIRISNEYGERILSLGAVHIAVRDTGSSIVGGTDRTLTFSGRPSIRMRPGAIVFSD